MRPGALILTSGPLDPADWWRPVRAEIAEPDLEVAAPLDACEAPPFSVAWIASIAQGLQFSSIDDGPLVVVGHGTAGPLLPALSRAQRATGRDVGGYVFVDATLPRPGPTSHLDLLRAAAPEEADAAHDLLHEPGGLWPATDGDGSPAAPDTPAGVRPRDHQFWTETLPPAVDWPDAPCAYVRTGLPASGTGDTGFWARSARARGWLVIDATDLAEADESIGSADDAGSSDSGGSTARPDAGDSTGPGRSGDPVNAAVPADSGGAGLAGAVRSAVQQLPGPDW